MSLLLYAYALRTARPTQLRARALSPLRRRRFPQRPAPAFAPLTGPAGLWRSSAFEPDVLAGTGGERLRTFHAHYGNETLRLARDGDVAGALANARAWIAANPPAPGDAWHAYTTSTRVANWIAAAGLEPRFAEPDVVASMWRQLLRVAANVEDGVLGNHVIRNARALVLGGAAYGDDALADLGRRLLERELPEQILPDGGHYERSPVYHLVVLRDLLEIDAAVPGIVPASTLESMRRFSAALTRPDGAPALFNDGGLDLAPTLVLPDPPQGAAVFAESGYVVLRDGPLWLAFDCGAPAPSFIPAHAHADVLSFQLWWDGRPLVVDPGTYTYEPGRSRNWFRGTAAHSTVALDGRNQFRLWGSFRSGPLPRVELVEATPERLVAFVDWPGVRHRRTIELLENGVVGVTDDLDGPGTHDVLSSLPLGDNPAAVEPIGPLAASTERRWRSERFFERDVGSALVQRGRLRLPATIGWTIRC